MGLRISIGVITAALLGGTGYFAQQLSSARDSLQKREIEISKEKEASTKLRREVARLEAAERRMKAAAPTPPTPPRAEIEAGSRVQEASRRGAEKKAENRRLEAARERSEEIGRLESAKKLLEAQVQEMSRIIAEKASATDLIRSKLDQTNSSLAEAVRKRALATARSRILEEKARAEAGRAEKLEADLTQMNEKLKEQLITLRRTRSLLRVNIVNSLLFDSGSAAIRRKGVGALSKIAEFLRKEKDKLIQIEGHTDDRRIQGNLARRYPTNWELSAARAIAVVKFLESRNVSPRRLSAAAYSFHRPAAGNDTGEERAKNRRIVILMRSPTPAR